MIGNILLGKKQKKHIITAPTDTLNGFINTIYFTNVIGLQHIGLNAIEHPLDRVLSESPSSPPHYSTPLRDVLQKDLTPNLVHHSEGFYVHAH